MSRLPALALKKATTSSAQARGSQTRASRARQASRQPRQVHSNTRENGSQNSAITSRKYQAGCRWCQASA